jgi:Skp family chaperone for outer membrane proteins
LAGKLSKANQKIAIVDTLHARQEAGTAKKALAEELESKRAIRDALLTTEKKEIDEVNTKFDSIKETRALIDARKERLQKRADEKAQALHSRRAAAGDTTATDGAAAINAVNATTPKRRRATAEAADPIDQPNPVVEPGPQTQAQPYSTHEEVDTEKPISCPTGQTVTDDQIDEALRAHPDKLARLAATPESVTFSFSLRVVQRAKALALLAPAPAVPVVPAPAIPVVPATGGDDTTATTAALNHNAELDNF